MRWVILLLSVIGFVLVFSTRSPAVLVLGLLLGFGGLFVGIVAILNERIGANSRPEAMLLTDKEVMDMRTKAQQSRNQKPPPVQKSSASLD